MDSDQKKKYRVQFIVHRSSTNQDLSFLGQQVMLIHENEQKYFNKSDSVDNYVFVMNHDKIVMLLRQSTNAQPIKYLIGYGVNFEEEPKKNDYFCEFETLLANLDITKSKLSSEYKHIFHNNEKRMQKLDQFEGHKLKDLISYPQELIKKVNISKTDYFYFKKQQDKTESDKSDSSDDSSESSDDDSDSSSSGDSSDSQESKDSKKRKEKKIKKERKDKEKEKDKKRKGKKDKQRSKSHKRKGKEERVSKKKKKQNKNKTRQSREKNRKTKDQKKKNKDKDKQRRRSKQKKRSRSRSKDKEKEKEKEKEKLKQKEKEKEKDKQRQKQREKQRQKDKNKEKHEKDKIRQKQKGFEKQKMKDQNIAKGVITIQVKLQTKKADIVKQNAPQVVNNQQTDIITQLEPKPEVLQSFIVQSGLKQVLEHPSKRQKNKQTQKLKQDYNIEPEEKMKPSQKSQMIKVVSMSQDQKKIGTIVKIIQKSEQLMDKFSSDKREKDKQHQKLKDKETENYQDKGKSKDKLKDKEGKSKDHHHHKDKEHSRHHKDSKQDKDKKIDKHKEKHEKISEEQLQKKKTLEIVSYQIERSKLQQKRKKEGQQKRRREQSSKSILHESKPLLKREVEQSEQPEIKKKFAYNNTIEQMTAKIAEGQGQNPSKKDPQESE